MTTPPKKILIASLGTRGDVQPYVALARALARHGFDVVVATGQGFDRMFAEAGVKYRSLPIDYQDLLQSPDVKDALHSLKAMIKVAKSSLALQQEVAKTLWLVGLDEKPDLILFNLKATVMTLVARRLDVPALPTALQPVSAPTGAFPIGLFNCPDLGPFLNRQSYRLGKGLMAAGLMPLFKPLKKTAATELAQAGSTMDGHMPGSLKALTLQAYSAALVPTPDDWASEHRACGYWFTDPDPAYQPPADLRSFLDNGAPPVYIGFGSMTGNNPDTLTGTILSALKTTGQRAVLATGWGGLSAKNLPEGMENRVFPLDKAPHSWLFPRCAAVVHHGGAGTTHEALRWGKPSLICPVFGDQPFWGKRVHAVGAGPEPIKQKNLTPALLASALKDLEAPQYRRAAEKAAASMHTEPGATGTADMLAALLTLPKTP